jgi:hypothetical protein
MRADQAARLFAAAKPMFSSSARRRAAGWCAAIAPAEPSAEALSTAMTETSGGRAAFQLRAIKHPRGVASLVLPSSMPDFILRRFNRRLIKSDRPQTKPFS